MRDKGEGRGLIGVVDHLRADNPSTRSSCVQKKSVTFTFRCMSLSIALATAPSYLMLPVADTREVASKARLGARGHDLARSRPIGSMPR